MAKNQSISLTLVSPLSLLKDSGTTGAATDTDSKDAAADAAGDPPEVTQPEWPEKPDGGFAEWLKDTGKGLSQETLNEYWSKYKSWCREDGVLEVPVYVPKAKDGGEYSIKASYGELSEPSLETSEHSVAQTIKDADTYTIGADVTGQVTAAWEGPVYGPKGTQISPPEITQKGVVLSWGIKVTGSLHLEYAEEHVKYTLKISPRDNADKGNRASAYQSTIFAVGANGKISEHEVDLPDMSGSCAEKTGTTANLTSVDKDKKNSEKCYRHNILVDPCTKEVIREWDEEIDCPEVEKKRQLEECVAACEKGPAAAKDDCIKKCNEATK